MIDLSYSRQRDQEDRGAAWDRRRRTIIPLVAAFIFICAGLSMVWGFGGTRVLAPSPSAVSSPAREQVSSELLETTKGLEVTQQQAVDQLQVVQDQLAAQQAVTKKLSEQIATLTEKLDALQQSVDHPAPSVTAPVPLPQPSKARGK
jgi:uncharacterized coiled-coil protein SlyX